MKLLLYTASVLLLLCSCSSKASTKTNEASAPVGKPLFVASADSLYSFVEQQMALGPRNPGSEGHSRCISLINSLLSNYGVDSIANTPFSTTDFNGTPLKGNNIFASINPQAENRTLLLAHFDTRPWADADPDPENRSKPVPGANDGASGVAVLLEIARLTALQAPDSVGIDLLFVDLEDSGTSGSFNSDETWCLGTQHWVDHMPYSPASLPSQAILFDMVGGSDALFHKEYISVREAPALVNRFWETARRSGFADRFPSAVGGGVVDDHLFINRAGIPCIDIIESANPQTGTFPPQWHTLSDNLSSISPESLRAVAQTTLNFLFPAN